MDHPSGCTCGPCLRGLGAWNLTTEFSRRRRRRRKMLLLNKEQEES